MERGVSVTKRVKERIDQARGVVMGADGIQKPLEEEEELNRLAAQVFREPPAQKFLSYLRSITINNLQGSGVSDNELRHMEGQRYIVALIERRIEHGRRSA